MRDIHVIYADSNSADFAGFKNRLLLKWSQCKHSKKGTVRRDWNDVDNRSAGVSIWRFGAKISAKRNFKAPERENEALRVRGQAVYYSARDLPARAAASRLHNTREREIALFAEL